MSEQTEPGWWYYVECENCRKDVTFRRAPSPKEEERPMVRGVTLTCDSCNFRATYPPSAVQRGLVEE